MKTQQLRLSREKISTDFIAHAKKYYLNDDQTEEFLNACCRPLRKSIRVNTLKIDVQSFVERVKNHSLKLTAIPWCKEGFWVDEDDCNNEHSSVSLGNISEHLQGLFYIQEASSMLPPVALLNDWLIDNKPQTAPKTALPIKVLDLAAAPGSKTTQIAAQMSNQGLILANELSASRVKVLHTNLMRCGVTISCMSQFDGRKLGERLDGIFDFVLLDAPCGGEGTIRKDPNALNDWQLEKVQSIAQLQKELIITAYRCLKPGGRLVYSTCTLSPEENQQVALYLTNETDATIANLKSLFIGAEKSITDEGFLHVLPHIYDSEGFFVAAFIKPDDSPVSLYQGQEKQPFSPVDKKLSQRIYQYYKNHFGLDTSAISGVLKTRDKEVWLFPQAMDDISSLVRLNRSGIKLAEIYPNKIRSTHDFVMCLGDRASLQKLQVNSQQAEEYLKGRNIDFEETDCKDGEVIITYQDYAIGIGSLKKNKVKNQLPRDLVRDQIRID